MIININLLPWREINRIRQNRRLYIQLFFALISGIIFTLISGEFLGQKLRYQESRNDYLKSHISELNLQLSEIQDIELRRHQIVERISLIEALQDNREIAVRIFDQIVYTTPEGVFYEKLDRSGNILSIIGVGESSDQISDLMRRLDASEWLHSPILDLMESKPEKGFRRSAFNLSVHIETPNQSISKLEI